MDVVALALLPYPVSLLQMKCYECPKCLVPMRGLMLTKGAHSMFLTITSKRIKLQSRADSQIAENFMSFF